MHRNIFYDKINIAYGNRKNELSNDILSFEEILNYFKLRNCWLNSKLCAKRKLSHSDVNTCVLLSKRKQKVTFEIWYIGYWNCLFSGYISRRIYKIIMLSHKKNYIQPY